MDSDKYKDVIIQGFDAHAHFTSGERYVGGKANWDLDDDPEFLLDITSPRYQACLQRAHELKEQYPLTANISRAELIKREKAIVAALSQIVHEQYGDYNTKITSSEQSITHYSMHDDVNKKDTKNPANLGEFGKGELVCRHYAPLAAALCTEAGLLNFHVSGSKDSFPVLDGLVRNEKPLDSETGRHAFCISRLTGNIIEFSTDQHDANYAYRMLNNELSLEDILAGKTMLTANRNDISAYGSYFSGDANQEAFIETRKQKILAGQLKDLPAFSYHTAGETVEQYKAKEDAVDPAVYVYDLNTARNFHYRQFGPRIEALDKAAKMGDLDAVKRMLDEKPLNGYILSDTFETAVKAGHADVARFLMAQGASVDKGIFTHALKNAIKTQQNLPIAELAIEQLDNKDGTLAGFRNEVRPGPPEKILFPFLVDLNETTLNVDFMRGLVRKLELEPMKYLNKAIDYGWPQHAEIALEEIKKLPKTEAIKAQFLVESIHAERCGREELAQRLRLFRKYEYGEKEKPVALPPDELEMPPLQPAPEKVEEKIEAQTSVASQPKPAPVAPPTDHSMPWVIALIGAAVCGVISMLSGASIGGIIAMIVGGLAIGAAGAAAYAHFSGGDAKPDAVPSSTPTQSAPKEEKHASLEDMKGRQSLRDALREGDKLRPLLEENAPAYTLQTLPKAAGSGPVLV